MEKEYKPSKKIVKATKKWLGEDGKSFFSGVYEKYGTLIAVWMEGGEEGINKGFGIPHPVHFREGMQVRNFLRTLDETKKWDAHDFDNRWENIVLKAIGK